MSRNSTNYTSDFLQSLLNTATEGIWSIGNDGLITFVNDSAVKMFGYQSASEMVGKNSHELVHYKYPDGSLFPQSECPVLHAFREGKPIHLEEEVLWRADGTSFYADYRSVPIILGGEITGALITFTDNTQQRLTQKRLDASQSDLTDTLESMSDAYFSVDENWKIESVNQQMIKVSGLSREELLGKNILDIFFQTDEHKKLKYWVQYHRVMNERVTAEFDEYYEPLKIWTFCRAFPKVEGGIAVFFTDITERKTAERDLILERHKLETIFQQSPAAMALWTGPNLIFEKVNPEYQKIFGDRSLVGRPLGEAVPELNGQAFPKMVEQVLLTGEPVIGHEVLAKIAKTDGGPTEDHYYDFSFLRIVDIDGNPYGVYDHAIDVTDRVKARRDLEASEEKLRVALKGAKMGTWSITYPDYIIHGDERFREIHSITYADENLHNVVHRYVHPDDAERIRISLETSLANKTPFLCEYRALSKGGTYAWVHTRAEPKYDANGKAVSISGVAFDISDQVAAKAELVKARSQAEQASDAKTAFLANMSHEIRTPLGAIMGFTDLLRDPHLREEERVRFFNTIEKNGKALTRIIDDILDLAKVESGKLEIEAIEFSFADLLQEVIHLFSEKVKAKGIHLRLNLLRPLPKRICSDPTRLRQILINLIGNAVKFTQVGGVTIEVNFEESDPLASRFTVSIIDTGVGIPAEQREKLFRPFVQADNSTTRKYGGTGLGLILSYRLAKALGGDIRIDECYENKGSTFVLSFRSKIVVNRELNKRTLREADANKINDTKISGAKILLTDDSKDNQFLVGRILRSSGAVVEVADNGEEAVHKALAGSFDVVLMDLQMPVMDGYEATRALRQAGYKKPIIALTAHAMAEERVKTAAAGCDGHITKPVNKTELIETVQKILLTLLPTENASAL